MRPDLEAIRARIASRLWAEMIEPSDDLITLLAERDRLRAIVEAVILEDRAEAMREKMPGTASFLAFCECRERRRALVAAYVAEHGGV